jgi:DNA-directed RNA polymerase subunit M/transcription elongation factor TFIIS
MSLKSCPSCGSALEYERVPAELESAHCATCDRQYTLVTPGAGPATIVSESDAEEAETAAETPALACPECGGPMELEISGGDRIVATCSACDHSGEYVLRQPGSEVQRETRPRDRERSDRGSPTRPCRKCGGPLSFSQDEDGNTVGECASCGNRFTLPPRSEFGGRGGGGRGPSRGYGRDSRGGGGRRFPPRGEGPSWDRPRRRFDNRERDDDSERPRRRRPR